MFLVFFQFRFRGSNTNNLMKYLLSMVSDSYLLCQRSLEDTKLSWKLSVGFI